MADACVSLNDYYGKEEYGIDFENTDLDIYGLFEDEDIEKMDMVTYFIHDDFQLLFNDICEDSEWYLFSYLGHREIYDIIREYQFGSEVYEGKSTAKEVYDAIFKDEVIKRIDVYKSLLESKVTDENLRKFYGDVIDGMKAQVRLSAVLNEDNECFAMNLLEVLENVNLQIKEKRDMYDSDDGLELNQREIALGLIDVNVRDILKQLSVNDFHFDIDNYAYFNETAYKGYLAYLDEWKYERFYLFNRELYESIGIDLSVFDELCGEEA